MFFGLTSLRRPAVFGFHSRELFLEGRWSVIGRWKLWWLLWIYLVFCWNLEKQFRSFVVRNVFYVVLANNALTVGRLGFGILTQFCKVKLMCPSSDLSRILANWVIPNYWNLIFRSEWIADHWKFEKLWTPRFAQNPKLIPVKQLRLFWSVYWSTKNLQLLHSTRQIK